ncbi:MAG: flippase [Theionarchaea archaeon]|nr:flippase [Theionarchaea archaeon]
MIRKSLLLFSVNTTGRAFQYLYRVVMSYFLTVREFGVLSASLPYQSFVLLFTSMSLTPTVSRFTSQYKEEEREKIVNVFSLLFVGLLMCGILYGSTGLFSQFFGEEFSASQSVLRILSAAVPFAVLLCICTGIFLGYEKTKLVALSLIVYQCVMILSSYILVQSFRLNGAAQGILFGYIFSGVLALVLVLQFRLPIHIMIREMAKIMRFSLPVLAGVTGLWGLLNVDILVLARFVSAEEVGLYGMAAPTARLVFGFSVALSALVVPRVSELKHKGIDTTQSIGSSFEMCAVVTLPIAVTLAAFSKEILYVLFGQYEGYLSLTILSTGMLFYSLFFVGYSALQGLGMPERSMGIAVTAAVCNIFLCFLFIPHYGLEGAAFATSLSCVVGMVLALSFLKIVVVPRIWYIIVFLPLFLFQQYVGILESRLMTMTVYGAVGLPFIVGYFLLSKKYLHAQKEI